MGSKMAVTRITAFCLLVVGAEERRERRGEGSREDFGASGSRERIAGSRLWGGGSLRRGRWSGGGVLVKRLLFEEGGASGFRRNH